MMIIELLMILTNTGTTQIMKRPVFNNILWFLPHSCSSQRYMYHYPHSIYKKSEAPRVKVDSSLVSLPPELFLSIITWWKGRASLTYAAPTPTPGGLFLHRLWIYQDSPSRIQSIKWSMLALWISPVFSQSHVIVESSGTNCWSSDSVTALW